MFSINDLPVGSNMQALSFSHFPTRQQAFVWRNWNIVRNEKLADVLETSVENITKMAAEMGLPPKAEINLRWQTNGYATIIRQNWHLLPYEQLLKLLGWTVDKLMYTLKEDDFLFAKLGRVKPACEPLVYRQLTEEEKIRTTRLKEIVSLHLSNISEAPQTKPFSFMEALKESQENKQIFTESGNVQDGFIKLDSGWKLFISSKSVKVEKYIEYFKEKLSLIFNVKLGTAENRDVEKLIIIEWDKSFDSDCPPETHRIVISDKKITVSGAGDAGVFSGLRYLVDKMLAKNGPMIPKGTSERKPRFDLRLIYPYFAAYGDPFMENGEEICPDGLLDAYAALGVNAIWFQTVLYSMVPFDKAPEYSDGYETRIKNLKSLIERASKYGIGIYIYLNEPRAMPFKFYDKYPDWKGAENDTADIYAICTSTSALDDLKERTAKLFRQVPDIAGIFTITASENFTHCRSHGPLCDGGNFGFKTVSGCPRCKTRPHYDIMVEVNKAIHDGAHSVNPDVRFIAWTWGWDHDTIIKAMKHLPKSMNVMSVSEELMPVIIGGVKGKVCDYSISQPGPGPMAKEIWDDARKNGLESVAKIQVNNTWECSAVPYIPVPDLVIEHLKNLKNCDVNNLMLSWTLGGSPSLNLRIVSEFCWDEKGDLQNILKGLSEKVFGENASSEICKAFEMFSQAFREFPEFAGGLYNGPHTLGPANLLYSEPTGYISCMTGFAYDDLKCWRGARHKWHIEFPEDKFEEQFRIVSTKWQSGLDMLAAAGKKVPADLKSGFQDLENVAIASYCHFRTTYLQIRFVRMRDKLQNMSKEETSNITSEIIDLINEEIIIAKMLEDVIRKDSRIGHEASNQYYYDIQAVREKVLNCEHLKNCYEKFFNEKKDLQIK